MTNMLKNGGQWCLQLCLFLTLLVPVTTGASATTAPAVVTCPGPSVSVTGKTSSSISFAWSSVSGSTGYRAWYVRKSDGYTSSVTTTTGTSTSHFGLATGAYTFYFSTVCDALESDYVIVEDLIN